MLIPNTGKYKYLIISKERITLKTKRTAKSKKNAVYMIFYVYFFYPCRFLRFVAYRQFVRLVWEFVGKSNRLPLPCCVYNAMRSAFPTAEHQYHGYEEEDDDEVQICLFNLIISLHLFIFLQWSTLSLFWSPRKMNEDMIDQSNCRTPCHWMTTSFTCVCVLWRTRYLTVVATLNRWDGNEWQGILQVTRLIIAVIHTLWN